MCDNRTTANHLITQWHYAKHTEYVLHVNKYSKYLEEKVLKPHFQSTHINFGNDVFKSTIK